MTHEPFESKVATGLHVLAAVIFIVAVLARPGSLSAADQPPAPAAAAPPTFAVSVGGKVKRPQQFGLDDLQKLPAQQVKVSFQAERGAVQSSFTGVLLWTLLAEAGGIDDPAKGAELHHIIRVTGRDGYFVVISTGEIAPNFGAKPAMVAYRRDEEVSAENGFRLVMPGDQRGGRLVRDVVSIEVE